MTQGFSSAFISANTCFGWEPKEVPLLQSLSWLFCFSLGVSSDDDGTVAKTTTAIPGEAKQIITTTATSNVQGSSLTTKPASQSTNPGTLPPTAPGAAPTSKPGSPAPSTPTTLPTTAPKTTPTSTLGNPPTTQPSATTAPANKPTGKPDDPPPVPTTSPSASQTVSPSASTTTIPPTAAPSTAQQKTTLAATSGGSVAKPAASSVPTQASSSPTTSRGSVAAVTTPLCSVDLGSCPSGQLASTVGSTGVQAAGLPPGVKDLSASSPPSTTDQPRSSPASPVQRLASSPQPGSAGTSPNPSAWAPAPGKTPPSLPTGITSKASDAATTPTPRADRTSQGPVPDRPGLTERSPTSAQPSAPAQGDQTISSRPGQQHPNISFKNEIICEAQIQDMWPIINLKEAKSCADWRAASSNESFFEIICSIGRQAFDIRRDKCTVTLASSAPQRWAVHTVVHRFLDPEAIFENLKEKRNELEKLGIVNVTYLNQEMEEEVKDQFSTPLIITIITLACSLLLVVAIYGCCHQRLSQKKNQQHIHPDLPGFDDGRAILIFNQRLTEELQTMENGYHDNPTLEVMETCSEMQEKKVNLNGELGDSWIVPLDTIMKEDLEEEEDTHL
ncbi:podocalyxin [Oxyura jamaicensis]|uniref:podocalyxin n=1 Tax=Oxyura jamaicensis TaxID=8884 RepID=UPI0015A6A182|nr:podocalyxin [Oxyura jamaicensis]